jgi:hypothetical protein
VSLLQDFYVNTGEIRLPDNAITHRIAPPPRRPDASGEQPLYTPRTEIGFDMPAADPAETLRISVPVTYGSPVELAEPSRPWFYQGQRRWTRSLALLTAATWPGGA